MAIDGVVLGLLEAGQADGHGGTAGILPPSAAGTTTITTTTTSTTGHRPLVVHDAQPAAHPHGLLRNPLALLDDGGQDGAVVVADATAEGGAAARADDGAVAVVVLAGRAGQLGPLAVLGGGLLVLVEGLVLGGDGRDRRGGRVVRVGLGLVPHEDGAGRVDGPVVGMEAVGGGTTSTLRGRINLVGMLDAARGDVRLEDGGWRPPVPVGVEAAAAGQAVVRADATHAAGVAAVAATVAGLAADRRPSAVHQGLDGLAPLDIRDGPVGQDGLDLLPALLLLVLGHGTAADGRGRTRPAPLLRVGMRHAAGPTTVAASAVLGLHGRVAHRPGALLRQSPSLPLVALLLHRFLPHTVLVVPLRRRMVRVGRRTRVRPVCGSLGVRPVRGSLVRTAHVQAVAMAGTCVGVDVHHLRVFHACHRWMHVSAGVLCYMQQGVRVS